MADKEYIEVEPLKKQITDSKRYVRSNSTEFLIGYDTALSDVEKMISKLPAADIQPVVYCKDCKYRERIRNILWGEEYFIEYHCRFSNCINSDLGFCSFGERMDGEKK